MSYAKGLAPVAVLGSSRFSLSRAASGQPRTVVPVAVVSIEVTWTAELAANGWLQPLTGSTLVDTKAMLPATVGASTYKDVLYAAPVSTDAGILYYRKDLVPNPPKTWDEMMGMCSIAKANKKGAAEPGDGIRRREHPEGSHHLPGGAGPHRL